MKKIVLVVLIAFLGINVNAQEQPNKNKKVEVEVNGVCDMCKKRIEKAAYSVKGVKSAEWHADHGDIHLIIDETKCSAKDVAKAIAAVAPGLINPDHVETNIVGLDLSSLKITATELSSWLQEQNILTGALGPKYLRLVTHLDLTDDDVGYVNQVLPKLVQRALMS